MKTSELVTTDNNMNTNSIVKTCKQQGMDDEFYPATDEIINCIVECLDNPVIKSWTERGEYDKEKQDYNLVTMYKYKYDSILDIGAGDGATLNKLADRIGIKVKKAIETNPMLMALWSKDISVVGCDFMQCTLWNKEADLVFCNPPFSHYSFWACKILEELTYCKDLVLVLPISWRSNKDIEQVIKIKELEVKTLMSDFNFNKGERETRDDNFVDIIKVVIRVPSEQENERCNKKSDDKNGYMKKMLTNTFKGLIEIEKKGWREEQKEREERERVRDTELETSIASGDDYPTALYKIYLKDKESIMNLREALGSIKSELLAELKMKYSYIEDLILQKLSSLEVEYWEKIIAKFEPISTRLISKERRQLEGFIRESGLDFTPSSIYHLAVCCINIVNSCLDNQILAVYDELVRGCDVYKYKSNEKVFINNEWETRSDPIKETHYKLTYRLVKEGFYYKHRGDDNSYYRHERKSGVQVFISDIKIIATNLGYKITNEPTGQLGNWDLCYKKNDKLHVLVNYKIYKNGNLHLKFDTKFMDKLNVIKGKLEGWLHDQNDVMQEFNVKEAEAVQLLGMCEKIGLTQFRLGFTE